MSEKRRVLMVSHTASLATLVEDDYRATLEKAGYCVVEQSPARLQDAKGPFDAIFLLGLDEMPQKGLAVIRKLRQIFEKAPIVVITGHGMPAVKQAATEAGASEFLTKPVGKDAFHGVLAKIAKKPPEP